MFARRSMCVRECMYVCVLVCPSVFLYAYVYVCMNVRTHVHTYKCKHVCIFACMCIIPGHGKPVYLNLCLYVCQLSVRLYACLHVRMFTYEYVFHTKMN